MAETTVAVPTEEAPATTREPSRYLVPPVDIYETQDGLVVIADLPGVDQEGVNIRVEDDTLTIEGKTRHIAPGDEIRAEYRLLDFFRQFTLGEQIDRENITAQIKNGVLTVNFLKKPTAKPRQIQVSVER